MIGGPGSLCVLSGETSMGYWGTLVVCRGDVDLPELPAVEALERQVERWATGWRNGWQGWNVRHAPEDLPEVLATAGVQPLICAEILGSSGAYVTGFGATGERWACWLMFESALGYYVPPPAPDFDDDGNPCEIDLDDPVAFPEYHRELAETRQQLMADARGGLQAAEAALAWAAGCGLPTPSVDEVLAVLESDRAFAEDIFVDLLTRLGLHVPALTEKSAPQSS